MKSYSIEEIIKYSQKIEQESYAFYKKGITLVSNKELIKVLDQLANEEVKHYNNLGGLIDQVKLTKEELDQIIDIDVDLENRKVQTAEITDDSTELEILNVALEREENTRDLYIIFSTLTNISEDVISLFDGLKLQEEGHVKRVKNWINKIV